ncbi:hypothetical protein P3X46_033435 [Hevea brasiliensis]|uniref:glucan endo-1,3-beta-D-glucosidase n=1 Tax=Hevea brasiliensis TaxID=3981 RepID=A0ABQ9KGD0_HEVBR|nr:hypothetical protein P3X46_033435 [Hevea brasiliensis]
MQNKGVVALDNSLFKPLTPSKEMVDPNTLLHYTNVLDAMIDAAYFSMKNLNITDVVVLVTETGWPSKVDSKEPYATIDNADAYNSNLIKHVLDRIGTPHPEVTSSVYICELFREDLTSPRQIGACSVGIPHQFICYMFLEVGLFWQMIQRTQHIVLQWMVLIQGHCRQLWIGHEDHEGLIAVKYNKGRLVTSLIM